MGVSVRALQPEEIDPPVHRPVRIQAQRTMTWRSVARRLMLAAEYPVQQPGGAGSSFVRASLIASISVSPRMPCTPYPWGGCGVPASSGPLRSEDRFQGRSACGGVHQTLQAVDSRFLLQLRGELLVERLARIHIRRKRQEELRGAIVQGYDPSEDVVVHAGVLPLPITQQILAARWCNVHFTAAARSPAAGLRRRRWRRPPPLPLWLFVICASPHAVLLVPFAPSGRSLALACRSNRPRKS